MASAIASIVIPLSDMLRWHGVSDVDIERVGHRLEDAIANAHSSITSLVPELRKATKTIAVWGSLIRYTSGTGPMVYRDGRGKIRKKFAGMMLRRAKWNRLMAMSEDDA